MAGKFLNLTFHGHLGLLANHGEDLLFKKSAKAAFGFTDAMDEPAARNFLLANLQRLQHNPKPGHHYSGLDLVSDGTTELVTFLRIGGNAWWQPGYVKTKREDKPPSSVFQDWLRLVFETPVDALVLAGHHENSVAWGAEDDRHKKRWYTALKPIAGGSSAELEVRRRVINPPADFQPEFPELERDRTGAGPFDLKKTLKNCRLLVIFGCNGATKSASGWVKLIQNASGRKPFVLGWSGVHKFPLNVHEEFISEKLWNGLKTIGGTATDLSFLHDDAKRDAVLKMWADAAESTFHDDPKDKPKPKPTEPPRKEQRHLFYERRGSGVGAIDTKGRIFVVDRHGVMQPNGVLS